MQKVYLLLRNNEQAGPLTLDELLALNVKPTDLIWIEGKSAAWCYPAEIKELQPYFSTTNTTNNTTSAQRDRQNENSSASKSQNQLKAEKKVYVSLPADGNFIAAKSASSPEELLEQKAEALRKKLQAYVPAQGQHEQSTIEMNYARSLEDAESDYINWRLQQKKKERFSKKKNVKIILATVGFILLIPLYFIFKPSQKKVEAAEAAIPPAPLLYNTTLDSSLDEEMVLNQNKTNSINVKQTVTTAPPIQSTSNTKKAAPVTNYPEVDYKNDVAITEEEYNGIDTKTTEIPGPVEEPSAIEKKKTIGEAIDGFFGKFKSKKNSGPDSRHIEPDGNVVRKANKREENTVVPIPDPEVLAQQVKVTATEPAENWMMGLKGLKLTLHNQSKYKLSKAAVEVSYFDEENTLLEKKTIVFQNIPPNKTITQAAPDHRLASYAKHQLVTVSGE